MAGGGGGEEKTCGKKKDLLTASVATGPVLTIVFRERFCIGASKQRERETYSLERRNNKQQSSSRFAFLTQCKER
jgi:hypothetical protein